MSGKMKKTLIFGAAAIFIIAALIAGKGWISSRAYFRTADRLSSSMPADLQAKYGEDLKYTVDKFWKCYEKDICSRNDMTDVMDHMKRLAGSSGLTDSDIFDFIGFVSRLYTDRLDKHHREDIRKMQEERQSGE